MRGFRQRSGSVVFVHSYKSEKAAGDSHLLPASATRSNDVDSDCNGCSPAPFHMGIDGYDVLQEDGRNELHCFYGNGGDRTSRFPGSDNPPGDIHLATDPAAEDVAVTVDFSETRGAS